MFVPKTTAGKLSVHKEVKGGTKDDGSGSVDKGKEKDPNNDEKASKGFFGRLGLRRSRSAKNINSAQMSVAPKEKSSTKETSSNQREGAAEVEQSKQADLGKSGKRCDVPVVGVVAVAATAAAVTCDDKNTDTRQEIHPEDGEIGLSTPQETPQKDDSEIIAATNEGGVVSTEAESAQIQSDEKSPQPVYAQIQKQSRSKDGAGDLFLKMPKAEDASSDDADDSRRAAGELNVDDQSPEQVHANGEPDQSDSIQPQFEQQEFKPFGEAVPQNNVEPGNESWAFGEGEITTDAGFDDGFGDSFTTPTQLQVDAFSTEPFASFNEIVDVVLDGDESVFDPNSPVSPVHFKAVPDGIGGAASSNQPNLSTSDVSISSNVDSLDDDVVDDDGSSSIPDKLPELAEPLPLEKRVTAAETKLHASAYQSNVTNVTGYFSNTGEKGVINEESSTSAGITPSDPSSKDSSIEAYQARDEIALEEMQTSEFHDETQHRKVRKVEDGASSAVGVSTMGENEGDLASASTANMPYSADLSPGISPNTITADQSTTIGQAAMSSGDKLHDDATEATSMPWSERTSRTQTDQDIIYGSSPSPNSSDVTHMMNDNVKDGENICFQSPASNSTTVIGDNVAVAASQFPSPNDPHRDIESNSEIPPIYEEPPREDVPIHELSSTSTVHHTRFPPNYLFSVQALYKYRSTDDDELSFNKGDIIYIIEHPDPEEQDDGWQMGVRQVDWDENGENASMGVFPENFTKEMDL